MCAQPEALTESNFDAAHSTSKSYTGSTEHFQRATENAGVENAGVAKMQGWKSWEWKTRHQTAGVRNAGVTSMESQNSRYLTLLQVCYNSQ